MRPIYCLLALLMTGGQALATPTAPPPPSDPLIVCTELIKAAKLPEPVAREKAAECQYDLFVKGILGDLAKVISPSQPVPGTPPGSNPAVPKGPVQDLMQEAAMIEAELTEHTAMVKRKIQAAESLQKMLTVLIKDPATQVKAPANLPPEGRLARRKIDFLRPLIEKIKEELAVDQLKLQALTSKYNQIMQTLGKKTKQSGPAGGVTHNLH